MATPRWTVVQHSGVTTGHTEFEQGLESRRVPTAAKQAAVRQAGGLLFDTYEEAEKYAEKEMYPDATTFGLLPRARGTFARLKMDGLHVYVPPVAEHRFEVTVTGGTAEQAEDRMRALIRPEDGDLDWGWLLG